MIQIRPQEKFPIVYRIADPNDSVAYYVRSVIRNSVTGAIIKNGTLNYVNLVQDANDPHRYAASIQAPNDASGLGFYIDVTTKVYTDSGYSVQSLSYLEKNDTYLVAERWNIQLGSGGGYVPKWEKVISEAIEKNNGNIGKTVKDALLETKPTDSSAIDLSPVLDGHRAIIDAIESMPLTPPVNLEAHTRQILEGFAKEIKKIKIPDNADILKRIDAIKFPDMPLPEALKPHVEAIKAHMTKELSAIREMLPKKEHRDIMNDLADRIVGRTFVEDPKVNRIRNLL